MTTKPHSPPKNRENRRQSTYVRNPSSRRVNEAVAVRGEAMLGAIRAHHTQRITCLSHVLEDTRQVDTLEPPRRIGGFGHDCLQKM
ncbi:hypothetical protein MTO96_036811 [Rhipicephalus appendiculatus]